MKGRWLIALGLLAVGCGGSSGGSMPASTPTRTGSGATATRTITTATPTSTRMSTVTSTPAISSTPTEVITPTSPTPTGSASAPTPTPTLTPPRESGPIVSFIGVVRPDGCRVGCFNTVCACAATPTPLVDEHSREVFLAQGSGRGLLVVEGRPGSSGLPVGSELVPEEPVLRPDLQIFASRPLGNGSTVVCDRGPAPPVGMGGGVPGIDPPDFGGGQATTDAMNDFACRFAVQPSPEDACTLDNLGNFDFVARDTTIQFCNQVASVTAFPAGDTLLTVRLRDVAGNLGPAAQVVIRNLAAAPTATPTP